MGSLLPGHGAAKAEPPAHRSGGDKDRDAFDVAALVNLFMQQSAALNQLWAMYAATTFTAGLFAFTVGGNAKTAWLLIPGAVGFFCFTFGHAQMIRSAVKRLDYAAADIGRIVAQAPSDGASPPSVLGLLAKGAPSARGAMWTHVPIDLCVFTAFGWQLIRNVG
jgi:hypothetical protein